MGPPVSGTNVKTERLDLIAGTLDLARADIENRAEFARLLGARVPESWPPPLNDEESMAWSARFLNENRDGVGWGCWYFVLRRGPEGGRVAVGMGGFRGKPDADGTVEVGYSVLEEFQEVGYATEAVKGLLGWAFGDPAIRRVIAETYPDLTPSIRVLTKNGFVEIGAGSEPGVIRFELSRPPQVLP